MRINEEVRRIETPWHVIRLWLACGPEEADAQAQVAANLAHGMETATTARLADELAAQVRQHLNAVEVLEAGTGAGSLVYPEWP